MSYEISSQFIEFRKQISTKIKNSTLNKYQQIVTPNNLFNLRKQSLTNNLSCFNSKQALNNITLTPQRNSQMSKKNKLISSSNQGQDKILKSPKRLSYYSTTTKSQQSYLNQFDYSNTYRQQDYLEEQNQIKQYSTKYYKIMNQEQGLYYSKLQAKLDNLSIVIGNQDHRKQNVLEIDDIINFSKQINGKQKREKYLDNLQFESKVLQNDILSIKSKQSRFSD
ncbi:unnamed protein product [Paramecium primaurelia]|uniref:Uncharacterized protein n=1 Tax=Paramecium primaurelia TaxID=5886 RepID=A0A8S1LYW7_PARPR|nr:unnamed protein product [Paramecium primaurelia]